jgi:hypothetical protein
MDNDTTKLLGLEGVQVTGVELDEGGVPWVMLMTDCEAARHCPMSGSAPRAHTAMSPPGPGTWPWQDAARS